MQQFISDSPWSETKLIAHVQAENRERPEYQQGVVSNTMGQVGQTSAQLLPHAPIKAMSIVSLDH